MEQQPLKAELTGRQRARMADLSLLLDVILKTQASSAKQAICKNGILHQLQVYSRPSMTPHPCLQFCSCCSILSKRSGVKAGPIGLHAHLKAVLLQPGRTAVIDWI